MVDFAAPQWFNKNYEYGSINNETDKNQILLYKSSN
jgi:hypothetical protein